MDSLQELKGLLSNDTHRIQLYDYVDCNCSAALDQLRSKELRLPSRWDAEQLASYLERYQNLTSDLLAVMALVGFWGASGHRCLVAVHARHFGQLFSSDATQDARSSLYWYPLVLQMYALGLGSVSSNSFEVLLDFFQAPFPDPSSRILRVPQILAIGSTVGSVSNLFKTLPDHQSQRTPLNEHLFDFLGPALEGILFFGDDYEYAFDRFELLFALQYAYQNARLCEGDYWAPTGRFGYKLGRSAGQNPYTQLCTEASNARDDWAPIRAGFFGGSFDRFERTVSKYTEHLEKLHGW